MASATPASAAIASAVVPAYPEATNSRRVVRTICRRGSARLLLPPRRHELTAGTFAWIPRDTPHTFANAADTAVRAINITVPGGLEGLFAEQGEYFAQLRGAPDPAELGRIGARYGGRMLGAPIPAIGAAGHPPS